MGFNPPPPQKNVRNPNHHCFSKKYRNAPPIRIAIRLQFVLEYFWCPYTLRKGNTASTPPICIAVRPPFVLRYASHLYRSTFGKILVVAITGMFPTPPRWARETGAICQIGVLTWKRCIFELRKAFCADPVCAQMVQNKAFWPRFTSSQEAKTWKENSLFLQC